MYPHVFPPHWVKGFCYNFIHPPLFCGIDENWDLGGIFWLEKLRGRAYGGRFFRGEETHEDNIR